ncbi:hypothetical protein [Streptomyces sp. SD31]|uniref:hypothetical protein n=1 Tax=Streptomyces sp. SD31 TaxID=3452208 RepID=UPI003F8A4483
MPFAAGEVRWDRVCAPGSDGHWRAWVTVHVDAAALWRLGLHPGQASAVVDGASPPGWWHAAGERYGRERWGVRRVS